MRFVIVEKAVHCVHILRLRLQTSSWPQTIESDDSQRVKVLSADETTGRLSGWSIAAKCPRLLYQSQCKFSVAVIEPLFLYQIES